MSRFFISDIHLEHRLMLKHRNFSSFSEMENEIVKRWNKVVKKGATVYVIGDFTFGDLENAKRFLNRVNGRKILIKGNHDRYSKRKISTKQWLEMGFNDIMDEDIIKIHSENSGKKTEFHLKHYPYERHWLKSLYVKLFGPKDFSRTYHQFYPKRTDMWHIHGHHHGGDLVYGNEINVSWETLGGVPISEHDIIKIKEEQEKRNRVVLWLERVLGRAI